MDILDTKDAKARAALHQLGLKIADQWASGFQDRPTQQLILQKIIDPAVKHILHSISPWIVGMAILFLVLIICTVVTCVMVLRTSSPSIDPSLLQTLQAMQASMAAVT
jgi:hypothetical protein